MSGSPVTRLDPTRQRKISAVLVVLVMLLLALSIWSRGLNQPFPPDAALILQLLLWPWCVLILSGAWRWQYGDGGRRWLRGLWWAALALMLMASIAVAVIWRLWAASAGSGWH